MPAGVDSAIADKVRASVHAAIADPDVAARIEKLGAKPSPMSGEDMRTMVEQQIETWKKVVESAGIEKR